MAESRRTVGVVTGTRAEYGLLTSSMEAIEARDDLELATFVTGMHLSSRYGHTVEEIETDGFDIEARIDMLVDGDSGVSMAKSLGVGTMSFAEAFRASEPDIVLVLGDRDEPLAAALAAAHMHIPIAHIHGGDAITGAMVDDSIRHSLTKFAHLHFPASDRSAERVSNLGEADWRITTVGAPGLDDILAGRYEPPDDTLDALEFDPGKPLILALQHPVTLQPERAGEQMRATLDAIDSFGSQVLLIYPNSDAGSAPIIDEIEARSFDESVRVEKSLPRERFLGVMAAADVMVGNSSSGIIEAPSFGLPVVDIGSRQETRERAANVLHAEHDVEAIREAIDRCLHDEVVCERARICENPYDKGGAGERIVERLASVPLDEDLLRKRLTY